MKLSWNLVFQGIATAAQYGNQALDIAPPKFKPAIALVIGALQLLAAWRAHYFNPDGSPASSPYVKKIIAAFAILALVAIAHPAVAQTVNAPNIYAAGVSYNSSASPAIAGTGLYARSVSDSAGTYALAVVDVLPNTVKPFTVTTIFSPGIAQKFATLGKVTLYSLSSAGLAYNGSNTGWGWTAGGAASVPLKGKWRAFPNVRVAKSSVSNGTGYQLNVGLLFGRAF